jgi:hypothetical protein
MALGLDLRIPYAALQPTKPFCDPTTLSMLGPQIMPKSINCSLAKVNKHLTRVICLGREERERERKREREKQSGGRDREGVQRSSKLRQSQFLV